MVVDVCALFVVSARGRQVGLDVSQMLNDVTLKVFSVTLRLAEEETSHWQALLKQAKAVSALHPPGSLLFRTNSADSSALFQRDAAGVPMCEPRFHWAATLMKNVAFRLLQAWWFTQVGRSHHPAAGPPPPRNLQQRTRTGSHNNHPKAMTNVLQPQKRLSKSNHEERLTRTTSTISHNNPRQSYNRNHNKFVVYELVGGAVDLKSARFRYERCLCFTKRCRKVLDDSALVESDSTVKSTIL